MSSKDRQMLDKLENEERFELVSDRRVNERNQGLGKCKYAYPTTRQRCPRQSHQLSSSLHSLHLKFNHKRNLTVLQFVFGIIFLLLSCFLIVSLSISSFVRQVSKLVIFTLTDSINCCKSRNSTLIGNMDTRKLLRDGSIRLTKR